MTIEELTTLCNEHDYDYKITYESDSKEYCACIRYGCSGVAFEGNDTNLESAIDKCVNEFTNFLSEYRSRRQP